MINFASDNYAPTHPQVLKRLSEINQGSSPAYGNDETTKLAQLAFKKEFGEKCEAFFVWNGTAANVLGLASQLKPYQSILCSDLAHIAVDECGAPEKHLGSKLIQIPSQDGRITVASLQSYFNRVGDVHATQPKVLSLTQVTEYGTVYSLSELKLLTQFAHEKNMRVHLDGARLANAAVALDVSFKTMITDLKIDVVSFGGTKNGLMGAEAIVFPFGDPSHEFAYLRKQGLHLASKMRYLSAQFLAYFENDLWKQNATQANAMAKRLAGRLSKIGGETRVNNSVEANGVFVSLPKSRLIDLQKQFQFYLWNEAKNEARLMCSFNTTEAEVDAFVNVLTE